MEVLGRTTCRIQKRFEKLKLDLAYINVSFKMEHSFEKGTTSGMEYLLIFPCAAIH